MKKSVLIEVIINNQCNKRCEYCDLDFKNQSMSYENLDILVNFLQNNSTQVEYFHINFFGGEPLLSFDKIKYFTKHVGISNIKYSIGTNGVLLTSEMLELFKKHNFQIYLSVDNIDGVESLTKLELEQYLDLIQVNFINDPDFLYRSQKTLDTIVEKGFKNINFMPVFTTKQWGKAQLIGLKTLKKYAQNIAGVEFQYFGYYNGFSGDIQFVLESDMTLYKDLDSLIWLQKQYSLLPVDLKKQLEKQSKIGILGIDILDVNTLISLYDNKDVLNLIMSIPKVLGSYKQIVLIDKILKDGA